MNERRGSNDWAKRTNLRDVLSDKLLDDIKKGKYKVGDKLPTQDELCERWNVSRTSIREAMNKLHSIGVVDIQQGRGTFVLNSNEQENSIHLILEKTVIIELLEARRVLEPAIIDFAIEKYTDEDLAQLEENLSRMEEAVSHKDSLEFAVFDYNFHKLILESGGNSIINSIMTQLRDYIESQQKDIFEYTAIEKIESIEQSFNEHREIFEALKQRDKEKSVLSMRSHIERINALVNFYYEQKDNTDIKEE